MDHSRNKIEHISKEVIPIASGNKRKLRKVQEKQA
jgi:hypothetical protein